MARATLTAANSVFMLMIPELFPIPQQLQGYATDDVFSAEAVDSVELQMGVDGRLAGGWLPTMKKTTFTLQADSPSCLIFDAWQQNQEAIQDAFVAQGFATLPSLGRSYVMTTGFLSNYSPIPNVRKIVQPRTFQITWESIIVMPV